MSDILRVDHLSKEYADFTLDNISFSVPSGAIMGFIGENGAGKTTTMKLILGLIQKSGGEVMLFGQQAEPEDAHLREDIGVVFDECCFHEALTADQVQRILQKCYKNWDDRAYADWLKRFKLDGKKVIKEYSRGMKTKLSLAAALSHNAKLLILDEALDGLDPIARDEMLDVFLEFTQDEEKSILLSLHNTDDLMRICDYITFIRQGQIALSEVKDDLIDRCGIIRCGKSEMEKIDRALLLGGRRYEFGYELLTGDRTALLKRYPDLIVDAPKLNEIMLLYGREVHA